MSTEFSQIPVTTEPSWGRRVVAYVRLLVALARFGLQREMAFRGNFLAKMTVEILWIFLIIIFYDTVFGFTTDLQGWTRARFFVFLGCYQALGGIIETFFLSNCEEFSELIRTGDLDIYLLKPIDEQFLVTCRTIDWAAVPNILMGFGMMIYGLSGIEGWRFDLGAAALFLGLFLCGVAMAFSFLLILTSAGVWMVRNQSLME